ncbi:hypothetical protein ACHWQZ_G017878 [Mnemiopsis leidyi]
MTTVRDVMTLSSKTRSSTFSRLALVLFEEQTCTDITLHGPGIPKAIRVENLYILPYTDAYTALVTNGTYPQNSYSMCLQHSGSSTGVACALADNWKCDGFSSCLTDECGCGNDTFKCTDGTGCITLDQVCDSRPDCLDLSDECPCPNYQQCTRTIHIEGAPSCFVSPNCSEVKEEAESSSELKILEATFFRRKEDVDIKVLNGGPSTAIKPSQVEFCKNNIKAFSFHCDRLTITSNSNEWGYSCTNTTTIGAIYLRKHFFHTDTKYKPKQFSFVFCDGIKNCQNGVDEFNCPGMFYCKSDQQPVPQKLTCDSIADCADSSDECNNCTMSSIFTSQTDLIGHDTMLVILMAEVLGILSLNSYALNYHGHRFKGVDKSSLKVDIIQCFTLSLYDTLLAAYLLIICWKHWEFRGKYCSIDVTWRSSALCKIAGAISSAASHGALQVVVATSLCRYYQIRNVLSRKRIKVSKFLPGFILFNVFNLAMAIVPLIATFFSSSEWAHMFLHEFFFKKNPFIRRGAKPELSTLVSHYTRENYSITIDRSTSELFKKLRNMTSKGELFSEDRITSVGLYGTSPLCYPDLFSTEGKMLGYKILYMIENSIYLIVTIVCYVSIVQEFVRSRKVISGRAVENPQSQFSRQRPAAYVRERNEDKSFYLSIKVAIVIGSQLFCWLPIHGSIMASFFGVPPPKIITDIFIANVAPINAIINPCIHTNIVARSLPLIQEKLSWSNRYLRRPFRSHSAVGPSGEQDIEMTSTIAEQKIEEDSCESTQESRRRPNEGVGELDK